jgi:hypothetical protein
MKELPTLFGLREGLLEASLVAVKRGTSCRRRREPLVSDLPAA